MLSLKAIWTFIQFQRIYYLPLFYDFVLCSREVETVKKRWHCISNVRL
jgi:hypothetical protein